MELRNKKTGRIGKIGDISEYGLSVETRSENGDGVVEIKRYATLNELVEEWEDVSYPQNALTAEQKTAVKTWLKTNGFKVRTLTFENYSNSWELNACPDKDDPFYSYGIEFAGISPALADEEKYTLAELGLEEEE